MNRLVGSFLMTVGMESSRLRDKRSQSPSRQRKFLLLSTVMEEPSQGEPVCMVLPKAGGLKSRMCLLPYVSTVLCSVIRLPSASFYFSFSFHPTRIQPPARLTTHQRVSLSGAGAFPCHCPERPAQGPGAQPAPHAPPHLPCAAVVSRDKAAWPSTHD